MYFVLYLLDTCNPQNNRARANRWLDRREREKGREGEGELARRALWVRALQTFQQHVASFKFFASMHSWQFVIKKILKKIHKQIIPHPVEKREKKAKCVFMFYINKTSPRRVGSKLNLYLLWGGFFYRNFQWIFQSSLRHWMGITAKPVLRAELKCWRSPEGEIPNRFETNFYCPSAYGEYGIRYIYIEISLMRSAIKSLNCGNTWVA